VGSRHDDIEKAIKTSDGLAKLDDLGEIEMQLDINPLLINGHLPTSCIGGVMMLNDRSMRCIGGNANAIDISSHIK
jgi:hypothetical protein